VSSNIYFAHVGLDLGAQDFLTYARRFGFCEPIAIGPPGRVLGVAPSYVTDPVDDDCGEFSDDVELASAAFGQGSVQVTPVQMAMVAAAIAGDGVMPQPWIVRDVRSHVEGRTMGDDVIETFGSLGGTRVISSEAAGATRAAMVDAVNGELGRLFAGGGDIRMYGITDELAAGKTGTAQLGGEGAPHSWFIGFAPAGPDAQPEIAIAVIVERGGSGSGRAAPIAGRVMAEYLRLSGGG
jgi:cell division protein FtsI/penicillin-binding protein 2